MNNFKHNHTKRNCNVDIKETVKVAEITDPFGNLRYKVALISYDDIDDGKYILKYRIEVINHFGPQEPLIIVQRPEFDEDEIYDYNKAIELYYYYVKSYSNLVKAETKDHQCIDIYKDNIGYQTTIPKCCATCKWSRKRVIHKDFIYGVSGKLECVNPENCKKYNSTMLEPHYHHRHTHDMMHGHCYRHDDYAHDIIYPTVDPFGQCDYYVKAVKQQVPVPGQSITDFIDIRIGSRLDDRVEQIAKDIVTKSVEQEVNDVMTEIINNSNNVKQ